jgi:hypothetical protein
LPALVVATQGWTLLGAESAAPAEWKYEGPKHLAGAIYAPGGEAAKPLFNFKREATRSGSRVNVVRDYAYPDGRLAARERVVYEGDALVSYQLEESQIGAKGSARIRRAPGNTGKGTIEFAYRADASAEGRPSLREEPWQEDTLVSDMVAPFLALHCDALQRGEKVRCRYIVVPRRETVGFTFLKQGESKQHGVEVIILKMEPTSPFIAALVSPLIFALEKAAPHRVLQCTGRTTPKLQVGSKWKDLDAVTIFDWK